MENRMLAQMPAFSVQGLANGSFTEGVETFSADQLPLRDRFVSLYAVMQTLSGKRLNEGVISGADGWLFDRSDGWSERNVRLNASSLQALADACGKQACLLAVPSSAAVCSDKVPALAPLADEEKLLAAAGSETTLLPLLDAMKQANGGHAQFYRTDHHWTAAGAWTGYETVCAALGLTPIPAPETVSYPGFYGSYYARSPLPWMAADTFSCALPEGITLRVGEEEKEGLLDPAVLEGRDKYAALLWGNHPLIELENAQAPRAELLVIKDSYANALMPLLARHYSRITAVDARYYTGNIAELTECYEGEVILCIYGLSTLATGRTIALMDGMPY